ncbi:DNA polymerase [Brevibacillus sp. SAFN-007a]|uniref:DNA polymerase n=1 Tax=Brevibacillus sp. SAFN-007a TaxID=3436862 RepID=UPI003F804C18
MTVLQIDLETYSSVDLKKCGVYRYVEAPDFEILLFGYAYDDDPVTVVDLTAFEDLPERVLRDLTDPTVMKTAFNANFERTAIARHFGIECDPLQWRCTAVHTLALGLPGYLEGVAEVLKLPVKKDGRGKALIKYFSEPCKPTKANGGRTRNYPHHDPEKWQQYIEYNRQDVVVEREVRRKLARFPVPAHEWKLWALDQRINDRGVRLDPELVRQAIACDEQYEARLIEEAKELTGLDNPNSLTQLKEWLADRGLETPDGLSKEFMPALLDAAPDDETRRVLELRQEMSKTSVDKYNAMQRSICADDRARGLLQFCGANRTWRWAGRLIQVQNLPQNKIEDLALARETLRSGDFDLLEMLFGAPPFVLSQLIRTAFIPSPGCRFIVSDFSAIEARVIAWLADEHWVLDVFRGHGKIYEATAAQMFKVPLETIVKGHSNYELRAKGKVATLACIAEGQMVLTHVGLVPIEKVTIGHLLWDGEEWVPHDGVIDRGEKEVFDYDGLTATADHIVWIEGESRPVRFDYAAASGARLLQSGDGRDPIRVGSDHQFREALEAWVEGPNGADAVHLLRDGAMDSLLQLEAREVTGVPGVFTASEDSDLAGSSADRSKATLRESERSAVPQLRRPGDTVQLPVGIGSGPVGDRQSWPSGASYGDRSREQRRPLRAGESPLGDTEGAMRESENHGTGRMESRRVALCADGSGAEARSGNDTRANHRGSEVGGVRTTEELAGNRRKARVYDILNAGPRNRFTVSGRLVHNCGYQGGPNALIAMGALKSGIPEDELPALVKQWREANPNIVKLWYAAEDAAVTAVREKTTVKLAHGVQYRYAPGVLFADLPSGRSLAYVNPRIKPDPKFGKDGLVFDGMDQVKKKWMSHRTYGGRLVENLVQAIARDCLAESLTRLDEEGYKIAMHVHDEVVLDVPIGAGSLEHVTAVMGRQIDWAPGLPLSAAAFECDFYQKD